MTQDKILDKLSKLIAARDGEAQLGNSAAAESFAEAINRMLLQHDLTEAEVPTSGVKDEPIVEIDANLAQFNIRRTSARVGWQEMLAAVVAKAHMCKLLVVPGSNRIIFVGTAAHARFAEYAYGVLASSADRMSADARDQWWRDECGGAHLKSGGFRASWLSGFVSRIAQRYDEARRKETTATGNSSQALMVISNALTRATDYIKDKGAGKASGVSMGGQSSAGYQAGRQAADRVQINQRGVGAGAGQRRLR